MTPEDIIITSEGELRLFFITAKSTTRVMRARLASKALGDKFDSAWDPTTGNITVLDLDKAAPRTVCTWTLLHVKGSAGEWWHEMMPRCPDIGT